MKKSYFFIALGLAISLLSAGCADSFLEAKPSTDITMPQSLADFEVLLDNTNFIVKTPALGHMSADEIEFLSYAQWQATGTATERNCYIWAKDIFEGEQERPDWDTPYKAVFYANNVLQGLTKLDPQREPERFRQVKGWAHFVRAYAFFVLAQNFSESYKAGSATSALGIPLRLSPNIDEIVQRSTLQETYEQIIQDAGVAAALLTSQFQTSRRNRPSKVAAHAFLARVYLSMADFAKAEYYADKVLESYNKLIDYNQIATGSSQPFSNVNDEVLYSTQQVTNKYYSTAVGSPTSVIKVAPQLIAMYQPNDLRLKLYYAERSANNYYPKRGYYGADSFMFTGLAVDEIYLIKAECLSRLNLFEAAMKLLDELLIKRYSNAQAYIPLSASDGTEALSIVLRERQKELAWRGLRWGDIKRLNALGEGIVLKRVLNGTVYELLPNDKRYVFPIPNDEVNRSGIIQNER